jgi:signal transduction histidine kinase
VRRFVIITAFIVGICAAMFYLISIPHNLSDITAEGGEIHLPWEERDRIFTLDGEWEFYYGRLYTPGDFISGRPEGGDLIRVPSSWDDAGYPRHGCATYRLTVHSEEENLMMLIPEILDSSIVWVNGKKIFKAGEPGATEEETKTSVRNAIVNIRFEDGQAEIVVQAANYNWYASGLYYSATVGRDGVIMGGAITRRLLLALSIGIVIAIGLYHVVLFIYHPKEKVYLAFFLICIIASLRLTIATNSFADLFLPGGIGMWLSKVYMLLLTLHVAALTFFAHSFFRIPLRGKGRRVIYGLAFAVSTIVALIDLPQKFMAVNFIPEIWSIAGAARSARARENPYNGLCLFALIIYILWHPFGILILGDSLFVPDIATNMFLTLSQCVVLAVSYAQTKRNEEELAAKTNFYHRMAHDLLTPLTIISSNIQVAKELPDKACEKLASSQAEIMRMAGTINDAIRGGSEE